MTILFLNVIFSALLFFILLADCLQPNNSILFNNSRNAETLLFSNSRIDTIYKTIAMTTNCSNTIVQTSPLTTNRINTNHQMRRRIKININTKGQTRGRAMSRTKHFNDNILQL
jgi:hypothetical protein